MTTLSVRKRKRPASSRPSHSNSAESSERAFEAQLTTILGADDQVAALNVPLARGAEGHQEGLLDGHGRLVAALLRQGEGADSQGLLTQRIGCGRVGVAAGKAGGAHLVVEPEARTLAGEGLAVQADRHPGGVKREDLAGLAGLRNLGVHLA